MKKSNEHKSASWKSCKISELETGDIIKNVGSNNSYIVTANYGDRVTAVNSVDVTNEIEWLVFKK